MGIERSKHAVTKDRTLNEVLNLLPNIQIQATTYVYMYVCTCTRRRYLSLRTFNIYIRTTSACYVITQEFISIHIVYNKI